MLNTLYSPNRWKSIDSVASPSDYVRYLDFASSLPDIQRVRRRMRELMQIQPGSHLLDVGCGTGDEVLELARLVSSSGHVTGIDASHTMMRESHQRCQSLRLPVTFQCGDAESLDFPDDSFDACRAERVLVHLANPQHALQELVRVTKPGGQIVIYDSDWETLVIEATDLQTSRSITDVHCRASGHRRIGRSLVSRFVSAGLVDVTVEPQSLLFRNLQPGNQLFKLEETVREAVTQGVISHEEAANWLSDLEQRDSEGRFLAHLTGFIVSGRKAMSVINPETDEE